MITAKTKICGIIADPVEHSLSPIMHNAAFAHMGLDYVYIPFRVRRERLAEAITGIKALNIRGVNVTIPHKVEIIPFLDELDEMARKIGAVNTIVNEHGRLKGYNTDGEGFIRSMEEIGPDIKDGTAVVLGSGGASQAISLALAESGFKLVIINRTLSKARQQAERISQIYQSKAEALALTEENLTQALEDATLLVNTTSVGMAPDTEQTLVPPHLIKPSLTVLDIVYSPTHTKLVRDALSRGAPAISGIGMLVHQGVLASEKWTNHKPPVEVMRKAVLEALKE